MFLLIDNYDSFTYNLVQAFYALDKDPVVLKNDDPRLLDFAVSPDLEMVCVSPGPGHPADAGLCPEFLRRLDPSVPVLGVCLGCQLLGLHAGADIEIAPTIMHGKQSEIFHDGQGIFANLPNPLKVGRYHSLVVKDDKKSESSFSVAARGPEGETMALKYHDRPWVGVQFHPESILTPDGLKILANFPDKIIPEKKRAFSFSQILDRVAAGEDLSADMAATAFSALMDGELSPSQAGAFLMGLRLKGESPLELAHATRAALARSARVPGLSGDCIDVVGTGGDGKNSFNCSTAASLILAGMGYKVVKHGNRAVSSKCGSADALEALGIKLDANPETALDKLDETNFAFLFAPHFHPSFKNIGPLRKELGIRTLFNILGPMINPARPNHLLMGVARPELVKLIAETLAQSPLRRGAVVCGAGGYDEMTPLGPAEIAIVENGSVSWFTFDPAKYGIESCAPEDLAVGSKEEAVETLKAILRGEGKKAMTDMVALNVALALRLLNPEKSMDKAMEEAVAATRGAAGRRFAEDVV
ncbi:MAG: anthranilate phosphoribosyltransferase [Desulfovibrio sp.]|nr:anthranilate phosphoribosyltransferase [Desulfovibrio sp.]